jgi:hypothetical protein
MEKTITFFDLSITILSMIGFLWAIYCSKSLFIKAEYRDVREILTPKILKYESRVKKRLWAKFGASTILLAFSLSRIKSQYTYISKIDEVLWVLFSLFFLYIAYIDVSIASPENEK